MTNPLNIKSLLLGAALALAAVCLGEGIARAESLEGDTYSDAMNDVLKGAGRGFNCEVIELQDGSFEAQCDEVAHDVEAAACTDWSNSLGMGETDAEGMYEACMVIALHTGAVH